MFTRVLFDDFRINSSLHATVVSCMCAYALFYDDELTEEPIW